MAHAPRDPNVLADDFGYDEELARWLAESGRRRAVAVKDVHTTTVEPGTSAGKAVVVRRLILFGVLTLSILQYVFADTALRIARLPTLIVFAAQEK